MTETLTVENMPSAPKAPARKPLIRVPRPRRTHCDRRTDILQVLAGLLEDPHCDRITTSLIAKKLDLSEAALYRSFPSKGAMFDGLIEFIESTLLDLFAQIRADEKLSQVAKIQVMTNVMLDFADRNRGLTRIMTGQVLMKEDPKLTERMMRVIESLETGLRQAFREAVLAGELPADFNSNARANLVMNWVTGRWLRFVLTGFRVRPNGVSPVTLEPFFA